MNMLGINNHTSALQWITQNSPCYLNRPDQATIFAWIHTHVGGNSCFLSSVDLHTQLIYEKFFPHILAIVVELGRTQMKNIEFYQLSKEGTERINHCNNTLNMPSILHESCANDERFFVGLTEKILCVNDGEFQILDARDKILSEETRDLNSSNAIVGKKI